MEKIEKVGTPLKDWDIQINYGVKTGYNEAFIIDGVKRAELIAEDPKSAEIIRPILRGRDIKRYSYQFADLWLISTHNGLREKGIKPIAIADYPAVKKHLDQFFPELANRADKGVTPYNLRNCAYWEDFDRQKIVWGNLNLAASFAIAPKGYFVNAPSPMIVPASTYLLAVLNSKVADYYIRRLGVTRNGGYFEYKPMFIEQLPVPILSKTQLDKLEISLSQQIKINNDLGTEELVRSLYKFTDEESKYLDLHT